MPTYIERCNRPHHVEWTHVHATRDGHPGTILYGTPGVSEAYGYPRLRTAWGDERLFSKNPPPAQPCTIRQHPALPHTHTHSGLWGDPSTGPCLDREQRDDGSWILYAKTAPSHSVTQRQVHLCEDPTHGGGFLFQGQPRDPHTHSTAGWGSPEESGYAEYPRVKDENGEDMLFSCDRALVTVEFTEPEPAKPEPEVHTVERCAWLAQHPSARHHHMRRAGESDRYRFWLAEGGRVVPTSYAYEVEEWPDGNRKVFGGTRFIGDPVAAPVTEWEDGGPSE